MIGEHVSYREATRSNTAKRYGIRNKPNERQILAMQTITREIFEPLRIAKGNRPIRINSFFRSIRLNKIVGGSSRSQHCKGQAMDLDDTYGGMTNAEMFDWIDKNLSYDQLIWEFGTKYNPDWVHVSYVSPEKNRKRKLRAKRRKGKVIYQLM